MLFYEMETPDGWAIPGLHGNWAADETDGYVQGSVFLIKSEGEALIFDTGNRAPGTGNSMSPRLIANIERDGVRLKYIFISHFHYDHVGAAAELRERYGAKVVAHRLERPIIEDPLFVTTESNATRFGVTSAQLVEDFNLAPGETLALSDPLIIEKYWSFPVTVDEEVFLKPCDSNSLSPLEPMTRPRLHSVLLRVKNSEARPSSSPVSRSRKEAASPEPCARRTLFQKSPDIQPEPRLPRRPSSHGLTRPSSHAVARQSSHGCMTAVNGSAQKARPASHARAP